MKETVAKQSEALLFQFLLELMDSSEIISITDISDAQNSMTVIPN